MILSEDEKTTLLLIARETIAAAFGPSPAPRHEISGGLGQPCGAFVTLHEPPAELRGCIGFLESTAPLAETVSRAARAAAFDDVRFPPLTAAELPRLEIEISVLSPLRPIKDPSLILVGEHGIVIRRGTHSGLLLPQVATERRWSREEFLDHTCLKAGLPQRAWREPGATIEIFSALVFNEARLGIIE